MAYPVAFVFSVSHEARVLIDMCTCFRGRRGSWKRGNVWNEHSMGRHHGNSSLWNLVKSRVKAFSVYMYSHHEERGCI